MTEAEIIATYGTLLGQRLAQALTPAEQAQVVIEDMAEYLEIRANAAQKRYDAALESDDSSDKHITNLRTAWREAEELLYLVTVAENVAATTRARFGW